MYLPTTIHRPRPRLSTTIALVVAATLATPSAACPAFLKAESLQPLPAGPRRDLRLFSIDTAAGAARRWQGQAVQVDPLNAAGELMLEETGQSLAAMPLGTTDRITLRVEDFGPRVLPSDGLPCKTSRLYELRDDDAPERFAYAAICDGLNGIPRTVFGTPVTRDEMLRKISSPLFEYVYQPNNQLIFEELTVKDPRTGARHRAGRAADILLHLDVKNFFTMKFTNDNVNSFVEAVHQGDVGLVARIQFYLSLLFFKIDLKMATLASWFADSANIPMMIDVPADGPKRLHPGSGMLFNWAPVEARIVTDDPRSTTPPAEPTRILRGAREHAKAGLKNCLGDTCRFRLVGRIATRTFTIEMTASRFLVEHGFYPAWVEDLEAFKQRMGWEDAGGESKDASPKVAAMYFETSGLPKGKYRMDYWIRLAEGERPTTCPRAVTALPAQP